MSKIKIGYVIDDLGLGGAQRQLVELVKTMDREKFDLQVVSLSLTKRDYEKELNDAGVKLTLIAQSGKWCWPAFWTLFRHFGSVKPNVVHTWLFTADLYGRLAAWLAGVPKIVSGVRNTIEDMPRHHRWVNRFFAVGTDRITVNAQAIRGDLVKALGIPDSKISTIYNGIDLKKIPTFGVNGKYRHEWNISEKARCVVMIARMAPQKDHETFLRAARLVLREEPDAYFVLVGDGPLRKNLEDLAKGLGIANQVRFAGERRDIWEILQHVDLFVLATHFEGCSNVILEAMAVGKPVVATDAGGNSELIEEGKTGFLVGRQNAEDLAKKILRLLRDPEGSQKMGIAAKQRIEENFTLAQTVRATESLYLELVGEGAAK